MHFKNVLVNNIKYFKIKSQVVTDKRLLARSLSYGGRQQPPNRVVISVLYQNLSHLK